MVISSSKKQIQARFDLQQEDEEMFVPHSDVIVSADRRYLAKSKWMHYQLICSRSSVPGLLCAHRFSAGVVLRSSAQKLAASGEVQFYPATVVGTRYLTTSFCGRKSKKDYPLPS